MENNNINTNVKGSSFSYIRIVVAFIVGLILFFIALQNFDGFIFSLVIDLAGGGRISSQRETIIVLSPLIFIGAVLTFLVTYIMALIVRKEHAKKLLYLLPVYLILLEIFFYGNNPDLLGIIVTSVLALIFFIIGVFLSKFIVGKVSKKINYIILFIISLIFLIFSTFLVLEIFENWGSVTGRDFIPEQLVIYFREDIPIDVAEDFIEQFEGEIDKNSYFYEEYDVMHTLKVYFPGYDTEEELLNLSAELKKSDLVDLADVQYLNLIAPSTLSY